MAEEEMDPTVADENVQPEDMVEDVESEGDATFGETVGQTDESPKPSDSDDASAYDGDQTS